MGVLWLVVNCSVRACGAGRIRRRRSDLRFLADRATGPRTLASTYTHSLSLSRQMLLDITKKPSSYVSFRAQLSIIQGIEHLLAKSPRYGHSWTAYVATVYRQLAIDSVVFAPVQMVYFFSIVQMFSELS